MFPVADFVLHGMFFVSDFGVFFVGVWAAGSGMLRDYEGSKIYVRDKRVLPTHARLHLRR